MVISNVVDNNIIYKVNKIKGIYSYLDNIQFESTKIPLGSTVFLGDNWYIIIYEGKIIDHCVLDFDNNAVLEYETIKNKLSKFLFNSDKKIVEIEKKKNKRLLL